MPKEPMKVYLSERQYQLLDEVCAFLGLERSEAMRHILLSYVEALTADRTRRQRSETRIPDRA